MAIRTYNIKLKTNGESKAFWFAYLSELAQAYDECAAFIKANNVPLNIKAVHKEVYGWMRTKFYELPSQSIIKTYKDVIAAYRSIRGNKHRTDNVPTKKGLNVRLDKRLYSNLTEEGISLTGEAKNRRTRYGIETYPKALEMFSTGNPLDPLLFTKGNDIYLSIPFEFPETQPTVEDCVGVDMGLKRTFVTSEGYYFKDSEFLGRKRKLRFLKRSLTSKGTKSAKRHLKRLKRKERNSNKNQNYKAVNSLISSTDAQIFVLEDLSRIKKNTSRTKDGFKRKRHNNMMSQVGIAEFRRILTYKALLLGKSAETVNPAFTSQTDSRTGERDGVRHGCRYICKDGTVLDADWNAAVNIGLRSKHPTLSRCPKDGAMTPLVGRAESTVQSRNAERAALSASC